MIEDIKKAVPYFLLGFALFSVIGFFSGWDHRKESITNNIYASVMGDRDANGYFLVHECGDEWTHKFYVEEDQVKRDPAISAKHAKAFRHGPPSERHLKHRDLVISLLGGISGGFTYKDVKKGFNSEVSGKAYAMRVVAGIVGGISGYALGYWAGSNYDTECDSSLANEILSDTENWKQIEREWIYFSISATEYGDNPRLWKYTGENVYPLEDDPIVLCDTSINQALKNLQRDAEKTDIDFGAKHFELLYNLTTRYKAIHGTEEYKTISIMNMGKQVGEKNKNLARQYGYTPENWKKACSSLEALIQATDAI